MVLLSHLYTLGGCFEHPVFEEGYIGVGFFFILSGFIIAYSNYHKLESGKISKREFWVGRIARIYPLHILTLFIMVLAGASFASMELIDWIKHFFANLFLLQAFIPYHDYYFSFNGPSWSLSCEQLFYFVFPFLSAILLKNPKRLFIVVLLLLVLIPIVMPFTSQNLYKTIWYVNPIVRLADFIIGMFLFYTYNQLKIKEWSYKVATSYEIAVIVVFLISYIVAIKWIPQVYRYSCFYWLPISLLLFVFSQQRGLLSKVLSNKYLVLLGKISFGIYLIHFIVIKIYLHFVSYYELSISPLLGGCVILLFVLLLSVLSYYKFEKPIGSFIKMKYLIKPKKN